MTAILCLCIGFLVAIATFLLLRRDVVRMVIGLVVLSNACNLAIFTLGGLTRADSAVIPEDLDAFAGAYANPLPQALVLTAIVIGFGLLAFSLILAYRAYQELGTLDVDQMRAAEPLREGESLPAEEEHIGARRDAAMLGGVA